MKNKKGFSVIMVPVLVLILAFVTVGGYYFWQKSHKILTPLTETKPLPKNDNLLDWKTYVDNKYKISLKYPQEYFPENAGPSLGLGNVVDTKEFIMGALGNEHQMEATLWTTLQIIDKNSAKINGVDFFLNSIGCFENRSKIPEGDINFAYEKSRNDNKNILASNINAYVLTTYKPKVGITQYGFISDTLFAYSTIVENSNSQYMAVLTLLIRRPDNNFPAEWDKIQKNVIVDYLKMVDSFKFL